jgi:hypothetical protein
MAVSSGGVRFLTPLLTLIKMKINKQSNYYAEDLVPYSVVRRHLRYNYGEQDTLIETYMGAALEYLRVLTDRVFCSSDPATTETGEFKSTTQTPKKGTVTVYFDKHELGGIHTLRNVTGEYTLDSIEYLDTNGDWQDLLAGKISNSGYPIKVDLKGVDTPADLNEDQDYDLYKVVLSGGENVKDLPKQFTQAALLLVGHYDNQREAEFFGGVSAEVKEGVHRLVSTIKVF